MSYFINKFKQKIAYKYFKGKSPGIIFIHGLTSDMEGKISRNDRANVLLAHPRCPISNKPPSVGSMA